MATPSNTQGSTSPAFGSNEVAERHVARAQPEALQQVVGLNPLHKQESTGQPLSQGSRVLEP